MKYFLISITSLFLIIAIGSVIQTGTDGTMVTASQGSDESYTTAPESTAPLSSDKMPRVYPIAPGVWYPGDGALPDQPMRYYRVRCWPGCHRGSSYGKYPNEPLNMKPIFTTRPIDNCPPLQNEAN